MSYHNTNEKKGKKFLKRFVKCKLNNYYYLDVLPVDKRGIKVFLLTSYIYLFLIFTINNLSHSNSKDLNSTFRRNKEQIHLCDKVDQNPVQTTKERKSKLGVVRYI